MSAMSTTYTDVFCCSRHALLLCLCLHLLTVFTPAAFSQVTWAMQTTDDGQVDLPSASVPPDTLRHISS